ncbi:hypothetical protein CT0861_12286 [Colletotrichum tofieldiae]|uniref:Uncharacterized protein n=1 Tax=Colletotrichum tofieldiae TaxID=708197 RepID=A0A166TXG5_9PEZI|nr:hypothetical protein CT0861_12286 [Colletotrichum tofieldiae]
METPKSPSPDPPGSPASADCRDHLAADCTAVSLKRLSGWKPAKPSKRARRLSLIAALREGSSEAGDATTRASPRIPFLANWHDSNAPGGNNDDTEDNNDIDNKGDSDSNNNEVIFLSAACVGQLTHAAEVSVDNLMVLSDDAAGWRKTCHIFDHDERHTTKDLEHCRQLPSIKRKPRLH